jgi:hypothetical protein
MQAHAQHTFLQGLDTLSLPHMHSHTTTSITKHNNLCRSFWVICVEIRRRDFCVYMCGVSLCVWYIYERRGQASSWRRRQGGRQDGTAPKLLLTRRCPQTFPAPNVNYVYIGSCHRAFLLVYYLLGPFLFLWK